MKVLVILIATMGAAHAACVNGVNAAGCVGPNGAATYNKNTGTTRTTTAPSAQTYREPNVSCARGVYRAGCVAH